MNPNSTPDFVLQNGRITTLDPKHPEAKSVAIKDGKIVGVDDPFERGPKTIVIDLKGRRVIPGLNDSHLHVIRGGLNSTTCERACRMACHRWRMDCECFVEQARRTPAGQWVRVVGGWSRVLIRRTSHAYARRDQRRCA